MEDKLIGFILLDSFYCDFWERKYPFLVGERYVVASEDPTRRVFTISEAARLQGITKAHSLRQAELHCPNLHIIFSSSTFKEEKCKFLWEINDIISNYCTERHIPLENRKEDEWYLDLSHYIPSRLQQQRKNQHPLQNYIPHFKQLDSVFLEDDYKFQDNVINCKLSFILGEFYSQKENFRLANKHGLNFELRRPNYSEFRWEQISRRDLLTVELVMGARLIQDICKLLVKLAKVNSSGGIAVNKLQARLARNSNGRGSVTALTESGLRRISGNVPICTIPYLTPGLITDLKYLFPKVLTMKQLEAIPPQSLKRCFPEPTATWIVQCARGICHSPVNTKPFTKEIMYANYKLYVTRNKELRAQLDLLMEKMLIRLAEDRLENRRDTQILTMKIYYFFDPRVENNSYEFNVDYSKDMRLNQLSQRCYRKIILFRGNDSKYMTITGLVVIAKNFFLFK